MTKINYQKLLMLTTQAF